LDQLQAFAIGEREHRAPASTPAAVLCLPLAVTSDALAMVERAGLLAMIRLPPDGEHVMARHRDGVGSPLGEPQTERADPLYALDPTRLQACDARQSLARAAERA